MKNVNKEIKALVETVENGTVKEDLRTFAHDMDMVLNGALMTLGIVALGIFTMILA